MTCETQNTNIKEGLFNAVSFIKTTALFHCLNQVTYGTPISLGAFLLVGGNALAVSSTHKLLDHYKIKPLALRIGATIGTLAITTFSLPFAVGVLGIPSIAVLSLEMASQLSLLFIVTKVATHAFYKGGKSLHKYFFSSPKVKILEQPKIEKSEIPQEEKFDIPILSQEKNTNLALEQTSQPSSLQVPPSQKIYRKTISKSLPWKKTVLAATALGIVAFATYYFYSQSGSKEMAEGLQFYAKSGLADVGLSNINDSYCFPNSLEEEVMESFCPAFFPEEKKTATFQAFTNSTHCFSLHYSETFFKALNEFCPRVIKKTLSNVHNQDVCPSTFNKTFLLPPLSLPKVPPIIKGEIGTPYLWALAAVISSLSLGGLTALTFFNRNKKKNVTKEISSEMKLSIEQKSVPMAKMGIQVDKAPALHRSELVPRIKKSEPITGKICILNDNEAGTIGEESYSVSKKHNEDDDLWTQINYEDFKKIQSKKGKPFLDPHDFVVKCYTFPNERKKSFFQKDPLPGEWYFPGSLLEGKKDGEAVEFFFDGIFYKLEIYQNSHHTKFAKGDFQKILNFAKNKAYKTGYPIFPYSKNGKGISNKEYQEKARTYHFSQRKDQIKKHDQLFHSILQEYNEIKSHKILKNISLQQEKNKILQMHSKFTLPDLDKNSFEITCGDKQNENILILVIPGTNVKDIQMFFSEKDDFVLLASRSPIFKKGTNIIKDEIGNNPFLFTCNLKKLFPALESNFHSRECLKQIRYDDGVLRLEFQ